MPTVSAHVARALAQNVDHVFGVMGNGNAYLLDALERDGRASYIAMRHEAGAVVAADAYHRASRRLAAATTTYGPGFTNTLTALAESVRARVPVVLVVGGEPTSGRRAWDVDQRALASAVGARCYTIGRADVVGTTTMAVEHALRNRVPVVLTIPYDIAALDAGEIPAVRQPSAPDPIEPDDEHTAVAIAEVARRLVGVKRLFLLAGRGAWLAGAGAELGRLARATGAITGSSALGRGIFPDARYDLGVTGGFGTQAAMDLIREADTVIVFGASLNQFTMRFGTLFAPDTHVIQIDITAAATHPRVDTFIHADARLAAAALTGRLAARQAPPSRWRESIDFDPLRAREPGDGTAPDGRLDPRSVAARIGELLPHDRIVVSDGGHFIGWANMYWPVTSPDRMIMVGTAFQSIGFGFASISGAATARPDSTIVLSTGDGGGLMALADLEPAIRTAAGRGIGVVWNDTAYGAEINLYGRKGLAPTPMRIPETDFAALARSLGAHGVTVRALTDLEALTDWTTRSVMERPFLLLDCQISHTVIAPYHEEIVRALS